VERVARVREMKKLNVKGKSHIMCRHIWEDDIKVDREEVDWKVVGWMTWLRIGSGGRIV
jgi:hypothetical protein